MIIANYFIENKKELILKLDEVTISKNIYIPKNFIVKIKGGQKINIINNSYIISESPWEVGNSMKKTFIGGKKNNFGGGLFISGKNTKSFFDNCVFYNLNGTKDKKKQNKHYLMTLNNIWCNWLCLEVQILQSIIVSFFSIKAEDALNIISSNFQIKNTSFKDLLFDGIDVDFGEGSIVKSNFSSIGNDAIDFSGSSASIKNISFSDIGDKIISTGEKSIINVIDIKGRNAKVGLASKDGSRIYADKVSFVNVKYPFAAYQKKKEYKYGQIFLNKYFSLNILLHLIMIKNLLFLTI